jgi:hypothetical protein
MYLTSEDIGSSFIVAQTKKKKKNADGGLGLREKAQKKMRRTVGNKSGR